jgi:pimeloyl-ACP methyl ester carboxylesterase
MPFHTTSDGARLHYRLDGTLESHHPALLFIHGWCSNLGHWSPQVKRFSRTHRILRVDRRGMGRSSTPGTGHTAAQHAADIAEVVRAAGLERVVVIGHAGGGASTLELARSQPDLVEAAVLVDTGLYPLPDLDDPSSAFGSVLASMIQALSGPDARRAFEQMYRGFFSPHCDRIVADRAVGDAMRTPIEVAIAELRGMAVSTEAIARGIAQPALWLTATRADQAYIADRLRDVVFGQVVGSGHFPQLEVPEQTNGMIATFIGQLAGRRATAGSAP